MSLGRPQMSIIRLTTKYCESISTLKTTHKNISCRWELVKVRTPACKFIEKETPV